MGQFFRLVNLDKRAMVHFVAGYKLWEFLISGLGEEVLALLTVRDSAQFEVSAAAIRGAKAKW